MRWGLPDAVWAFLAGFGGAIFAAAFFTRHDADVETAGYLAAVFAGQYGATVLALTLISSRKGRGSLTEDFGLRIRVADAWVIFGGMLLSVVLGALIAPLSHIAGGKQQAVVSELEHATGAKLAVLAIGAGLLAPVVEELLFRGLLLRALLRKMPAVGAVAITGFSFAIVHWILDPSLGTFVAVPALFAMGMISAVVAVRTGDLSCSIFLHIGFNLVAILPVIT